MKRKLPLGIQTFRKIREQDCYYVDKTAYARRLVEEGDHYFLSRPRRFGKSLFLDTLKELFEGNEPLFRGLAVHDMWDWSVRRPVVRLDFGSGSYGRPDDLHREVLAQLDTAAEDAGVAARYDVASLRLQDLLKTLHRRTGQRVVVLVDEYDKPILDALKTPEVAEANRDYLRGLYSVTKTSDAHIAFSFLTGVSKFAKVSLFSGFNNPTDLTLDPACAAICGYTEADLDTVFAPELPGPGPGSDSGVVQRLQLARRRAAVQPLRRAPTVPQPPVPAVLVRDRHAGVPHRHADAAESQHPVTGRPAERRRSAVEVRRAGRGAGGAAVPDRLPDRSGKRRQAFWARPCTGSAIRTTRCAGASTRACWRR